MRNRIFTRCAALLLIVLVTTVGVILYAQVRRAVAGTANSNGYRKATPKDFEQERSAPFPCEMLNSYDYKYAIAPNRHSVYHSSYPPSQWSSGNPLNPFPSGLQDSDEKEMSWEYQSFENGTKQYLVPVYDSTTANSPLSYWAVYQVYRIDIPSGDYKGDLFSVRWNRQRLVGGGVDYATDPALHSRYRVWRWKHPTLWSGSDVPASAQYFDPHTMDDVVVEHVCRFRMIEAPFQTGFSAYPRVTDTTIYPQPYADLFNEVHHAKGWTEWVQFGQKVNLAVGEMLPVIGSAFTLYECSKMQDPKQQFRCLEAIPVDLISDLGTFMVPATGRGWKIAGKIFLSVGVVGNAYLTYDHIQHGELLQAMVRGVSASVDFLEITKLTDGFGKRRMGASVKTIEPEDCAAKINRKAVESSSQVAEGAGAPLGIMLNGDPLGSNVLARRGNVFQRLMSGFRGFSVSQTRVYEYFFNKKIEEAVAMITGEPGINNFGRVIAKLEEGSKVAYIAERNSSFTDAQIRTLSEAEMETRLVSLEPTPDEMANVLSGRRKDQFDGDLLPVEGQRSGEINTGNFGLTDSETIKSEAAAYISPPRAVPSEIDEGGFTFVKTVSLVDPMDGVRKDFQTVLLIKRSDGVCGATYIASQQGLTAMWARIKQLYNELRASSGSLSRGEKFAKIVEIGYLMRIFVPYKKGSSGIADALVTALFQANGFNVGRIKVGIGFDVMAWLRELPGYISEYPGYFAQQASELVLTN